MKTDTKTGCPGLFVSALRGGSGKTILTIGITAALKSLGKKTAPFKKGPDYIDAGWLSLAAGRPCYNLDTFLIEENLVLQSYLKNSYFADSDIAVVEGNRGLYDGSDLDGKTSTAETAKLLGLPVLLCLDCTKSTRTMAAAVLGCLHFDPDLTIGGVVLNRVAGPRHRKNLINNIEHHTGIPVLGSIPKLRTHDFPERHMGLVPTFEHDWALQSIKSAEKIANEHLNLDAIINMAEEKTTTVISSDLKSSQNLEVLEIATEKNNTGKKPLIGIIKDSAFQFYYPENIEALEKEGAEIIYISPLRDDKLPELDGLYIGGGFPETHAKELAQNGAFRDGIKALAEKEMPIYAECGGMMYMGKELVIEDEKFPMTGIFPISFSVSKKPQGHGYVVAKVVEKNPYFTVGEEIKGHEFRYSKIIEWDETENLTALNITRGTGMKDKKDGILYKNVFACYLHSHAAGNSSWAKNMVAVARKFSKIK